MENFKYFSTKLGELYNGDCQKILSKIQSESIDAIVTDPPYSKTKKII